MSLYVAKYRAREQEQATFARKGATLAGGRRLKARAAKWPRNKNTCVHLELKEANDSACAFHFTTSSAAACQDSQPSCAAYLCRSSSHLRCRPGLALRGRRVCGSSAHHPRSRQKVVLRASLSHSIFASRPAHRHLSFKNSFTQSPTPAFRACTSDVWVA